MIHLTSEYYEFSHIFLIFMNELPTITLSRMQGKELNEEIWEGFGEYVYYLGGASCVMNGAGEEHLPLPVDNERPSVIRDLPSSYVCHG